MNSIPDWMPDVIEAVTAYYEDMLWHSPDAAHARALLRDRGITEETARKFRLGYAPAGWETTHRALRAQRIIVDQLEMLGLAIARKKRGQGGHFDRFRDRLMFPVTRGGQVVSLVGRTIRDNDPQPKYVRTRSTPLSEAPALFALDHAGLAIQKTGRALLVEGFFDVLMLHQLGHTAAAALTGTSLSSEQLELLLTAGARSLSFVYDGDAGGHSAAQYLAPKLRVAPLPASIAFCAEGEDPDDVLRRGGLTELHRLCTTGRDPVDLILDGIAISPIDSIERRVASLRELLATVFHPRRPISQAQLDRISTMYGISLDTVRDALRTHALTTRSLHGALGRPVVGRC